MTKEELDWVKDARNLVNACHYYRLAKLAQEDTLVVPHHCRKPKHCPICADSDRQRQAEVYSHSKKMKAYLGLVPDEFRRQMVVQKVALDDRFRALVARHVRRSLMTDPANVRIFPMVERLDASCSVPLIP